MKSSILLTFLLSLIQFALAADTDSKITEESPSIVFDWPSVKVESVKYHLQNRFINSKNYEFPVLIKEKEEVELILTLPTKNTYFHSLNRMVTGFSSNIFFHYIAMHIDK